LSSGRLAGGFDGERRAVDSGYETALRNIAEGYGEAQGLTSRGYDDLRNYLGRTAVNPYEGLAVNAGLATNPMEQFLEAYGAAGPEVQSAVAAEQAARERDEATAVLQTQLVQAQQAQSQVLLQNAEQGRDELIITAPISGLVELVRGGDSGAGGILDGLPGFVSALPGLDDLAGLLPSAPGGGNIQSVLEVGTAVATGQLLVRVYDRSSFTVIADVDEIDVIELAVGQPAEVRLDAFPGALFRGTVAFVSFSSRNDLTGGALYSVGVVLDDAPQRLAFRAGFRASADIEVRRLASDTVVPTSALLRRGFREVVFVMDGDRAREVAVDIVAIGEDTAAVTGLLNPGDRIVTRGVELLNDGDTVPQ
jgi:hypothetical protein